MEATWSPFANQNIGALAYVNFTGELKTNFQGKASLMAATGEANMQGDSYPGSGVYLSNDDGLTWELFFGRPPGQTTSIDEDVRTFPRRIGSLALTENGAMAIGSVSLDDSLPAGLYLLNPADLGRGLVPCQRWGQRSYNCHPVLFHPRDRNTIFASIEPDGSLNGIWRSRDFGKNWEHLTKGLPPADRFRRTSLAFAPSDPDVIYALASDRSDDNVLGVFRSTNGGNSWREILGGRYPKERQMSYNNVIAVHPDKPGCAIWGGMHLYRTDDAGRSWRRITSGERGKKRDYVHNDHHALLWPRDDLIVSGNDGGVSVSRDGGRTWMERSNGMVTTMFLQSGRSSLQRRGLWRGHTRQRRSDCRRGRLQGTRVLPSHLGRWRLDRLRSRSGGQRLRLHSRIRGLPPPERQAVGLCNFCSFFLTEWGDPGQIAAAALVLRFHLTLATWLGATLALMLKGAFAIILGLQIRDRLPVRTLRILSSVSCCILGMLAAAQSVVTQV